ncbi:MAG TPA: aldo/keto reductase [Phycisphaerales bacterium]|nr:aldo/keto reductase [Phycisphaerales bacterium]
MDRVPLGTRTGLTVARLGLGTVKLGRNQGVKYPGGGGYALPDDEAARELLRSAARLGINLLDTAPAYGTAEERLGALLGTAGVPAREEWVLCTKAGEEFDGARSRFDFTGAAVAASVERSLARLRTRWIDVVLLHSDGADEPGLVRGPGLAALAAAKGRGLVRAVGISAKTAAGALAAVESGACDVVMLTYNPGEREAEAALEAAGRRGVGVLVKKALGGGHAARPEQIEAALRLTLGQAGVSCVVLGTTNPEHLAENVEAGRRVMGDVARE